MKNNHNTNLARILRTLLLACIIDSVSYSDMDTEMRDENITFLKSFRSILNETIPDTLHVHARQTIARPEKSPAEMEHKLSREYQEMVKIQGREFVAEGWPTVEDYIAWYYNEIETSLVDREFEEEFYICGNIRKFIRKPVDKSDQTVDIGFDYYEEYLENVLWPKNGEKEKVSIEINHDKKKVYVYTAHKSWRFPDFVEFGSLPRNIRHGISLAIDHTVTKEGSDTDLLRLCEKEIGRPFYFQIKKTQRDKNPAIEFSLFLAENDTLAMSVIVDEQNMHIVYEINSYANGILLKSKMATGFKNHAGWPYPDKVVITDYSKEPGPVIKTFEIESVSTNVVKAEVLKYSIPKEYVVKHY